MDQQVFIFRVVTITLAVVIVVAMGALVYGLFDPRVDNKEIFAVLGPALQTTIGCFVGVLGGRALEKRR